MRRRALRASPRADFAVTAIRLQSLTSSRLRRCALRLPPGESPAGYPRRAQLGAPRYRRTGCAGSATKPLPQKAVEPASRCLRHGVCPGHLAHPALKSGRPRPPGRWPVALSCCASSPLRRLAPVGLPSFPRAARLTPPARLPASGLRASLAVRSAVEVAVACPAIFPDSITLLATVARGRVPSRRAGPSPRLRLRAAPTLRLSP